MKPSIVRKAINSQTKVKTTTISSKPKSTIKTAVMPLIKYHELQIRRLKAIVVFEEWIANVKEWSEPDFKRIARYNKAAVKLAKLVSE